MSRSISGLLFLLALGFTFCDCNRLTAQPPPVGFGTGFEAREVARLNAMLADWKNARLTHARWIQGMLVDPLGFPITEDRWRASQTVLGFDLDGVEKAHLRQAAHERHLKFLKEAEESARAEVKAGRMPATDLLTLQGLVADAEIRKCRDRVGHNPTDQEKAELKKLYIARRAPIKEKYKLLQAKVEAGTASPASLWNCSCELLAADLPLCEKPTDRTNLHASHLKLARDIEKYQRVRCEAGKTSQFDYLVAQDNVLHAEVNLLRDHASGLSKEEESAQLRKLLRQRLETLRQQMKVLEESSTNNPAVVLETAKVSSRLVRVELELADAEARPGHHRRHVEYLAAAEKYASGQADKSAAQKGLYLSLKESRLQAEIDLLREQLKSKPGK
jgi:hypothetical protein